jgi:hypothetical protein
MFLSDFEDRTGDRTARAFPTFVAHLTPGTMRVSA